MGQKANLNQMCPYANDAGLGDKLDALITLVNELRTDHATTRTAVTNLKTFLKNFNTTNASITIATSKTRLQTQVACEFICDGEWKVKAATDNFVVLTGLTAAKSVYNEALVALNSSGAATIAVGTGASVAASVVQGTPPTDTTVIGKVQVHPTGTGTFIGATTELDDGTVVPNAVYTDLAFHPDNVGDAPASLTAAAVTALT